MLTVTSEHVKETTVHIDWRGEFESVKIAVVVDCFEPLLLRVDTGTAILAVGITAASPFADFSVTKVLFGTRNKQQ